LSKEEGTLDKYLPFSSSKISAVESRKEKL
jgi:hypothetical protein